MNPATRTLLLTWAALLAVLAMSVVVALLALGPWSIALNLGLALLMGGLLVANFMDLLSARPLIRVFALGALLWVFLLFVMLPVDYLTR